MKRIISFILTLVLIIGMLSCITFADEKNSGLNLGAVTEIMSADIKGAKAPAFLALENSLKDLGTGYEFYDYGFNENYFGNRGESTPTPTPESQADLTKYNALANAIKQYGTYTEDGYAVIVPLSETAGDYVALVALNTNPPTFMILLQKNSEYAYAMLIDPDKFGKNDCAASVMNSSGVALESKATLYKSQTRNSNLTLTSSSATIQSDRDLIKEKTNELTQTAVAFLHVILTELGVDVHFSDLGINDMYFCTSGHDFSDYVYNGDATATLDGTKTAVCSVCLKKNTVTAEGTAGTTVKKTAFDKVADFLVLNRPSDYTLSSTVQNDGTTVKYSVRYNKHYDLLTTSIETVYENYSVTYSLDINRNLDGNYKCSFTGAERTSGTILLSSSAKIPTVVNGNYSIINFTGSETDKADIQEAYEVFSILAVSLFYSVAKGIEPALTIGDFGFAKYFMCADAHLVDNYTYNNDATYEKDGTKSGNCYFCNDKITITAIGTRLVDIVDSSKTFKDVKSKWYKKAVDYCYSYGFIKGVESDRFGLEEPVTRGMFITILARIAGVDTGKSANKTTTKFTDVKSGNYYTNAIKWASEKGIVNGISKTKFGPEENITREQICVMLVNFANYIDVELSVKTTPSDFADSKKISSWAKTEVKVCQQAGIVNGSEENGKMYFKPGDNAKRQEAAKMLYEFHKNFLKNG